MSCALGDGSLRHWFAGGRGHGVSRRCSCHVETFEPRLLLSQWLDTSSQAAVNDFYVTEYLASEAVSSGWTGSVANGQAGATSQAFQTAELRRVNYYRSMAGVPTIGSLDATHTQEAQAAALMMSANKAITHDPPSTWLYYSSDGAQAAANSNLTLGQSGADAIDAYMTDPGENNTPVGHRRWLLYPQTQTLGVGDIPGETGYPAANCLWVLDDHVDDPTPPTRDTFVAWPSPGYFPDTLMCPRWSFSYPEADFSHAAVTVIRNGTPVAATLDPVEIGYGMNTLVWEFAPATSLPDGQYTVQISNVMVSSVAQSFSYTVNAFAPALPDHAPTALELSANSIPESQPANTAVGTFSTTDPDSGDQFVYSFADGPGSNDNARFVIKGNQLLSAQPFVYGTNNTYSIRVCTTDSGGLSYENAFAVQVTEVPSVLIGTIGTVNSRLVGMVYSDVDGDRAKLILTGGGTAALYMRGSFLDQVVLTGTSSNSVLSISTSRARSGDGLLSIREITCGGLLKSISAPSVVITGDLAINTAGITAGAMSSVSLNGLVGSLDIAASIRSISVRRTLSGSVTIGGDVGAISAGAIAADLQARSYGSITTLSSTARGTSGTASGTITAIGANSKGVAVGKVSIGGVSTGLTVVADHGVIGRMIASQAVSGLNLHTLGISQSLKVLGLLSSSTIRSTGNVGDVVVRAMFDSHLLVGVVDDAGILTATSSSQFVNPATPAALRSFTVLAGAAYPVGAADSTVSAGRIGSVVLTNLADVNTFGIALYPDQPGSPSRISLRYLANPRRNITWRYTASAVSSAAPAAIASILLPVA